MNHINWLGLEEAQAFLSDRRFRIISDVGSLTARVRNTCAGAFAVQLINQSVVTPHPSEAELLGLSGSTSAIARQVFLCCDDQPKIFARTIIGLLAKNKLLTDRVSELGEQSLGSLLFRDPLAKKHLIHFARIARTDVFFDGMHSFEGSSSDPIWVRRTLYEYEGCELIVYEAFLTL